MSVGLNYTCFVGNIREQNVHSPFLFAVERISFLASHTSDLCFGLRELLPSTPRTFNKARLIVHLDHFPP
jgi:hypothetical protein